MRLDRCILHTAITGSLFLAVPSVALQETTEKAELTDEQKAMMAQWLAEAEAEAEASKAEAAETLAELERKKESNRLAKARLAEKEAELVRKKAETARLKELAVEEKRETEASKQVRDGLRTLLESSGKPE